MKLEVGMYVRTKEGYICKILKLNEPFEDDSYLDHNDIGSASIQQKNVIKASHNIIDLVQIGDYINGYIVEEIREGYKGKEVDNGTRGYDEGGEYIIWKRNDDIKSIATKEQMEAMQYKVN